MKLNVLHLSDIHLHSDSDGILGRTADIAAAVFPLVREADKNILVISGDVAFSGSADEYQAAERFVRGLKAILEKEAGDTIDVFVAPGNHDCVLKTSSKMREIAIEAVLSTPAEALNAEIVEVCTGAQKHFFEFRDRLQPSAPIFGHPLWHEYQFELGDQTVRVSLLNAAWMSRLPEEQGGLVFPIASFEEVLNAPAALRLAVLHHPFNWYKQQSYQQLRRTLRQHASVVLSGHEHTPNTGEIREDLTGSSLFFEAPALQPHGKEPAGFFAHIFDLRAKTVESQLFCVEPQAISANTDPVQRSFELQAERVGRSLALTDAFSGNLSDAGANLTHADKDNVTIDDIYVYPDLQERVQEPAVLRPMSAERLLPKILEGGRLLVAGEEKSGKSGLLLKFFKELRTQGKVPVYLDAASGSFKANADAARRIQRAIESQYANPQVVEMMPKERRVLLIDNIDRTKASRNFLPHLLEYADTHFFGLVCTADRQFEYSGLLSKEAADALAKLESYEMLRFGQKLRHKMIKKWYSLSDIINKTELDQRVYDAESVINSVIGKKLVPELPIYILILLQSLEQQRHGEIQNGGYGHYYQYLITKSLGEVGVKPMELNEYFNYFAQLAWFMMSTGERQVDHIELQGFNQTFSARFTTVDLETRLNQLLRARILSKSGDYYAFSYPYIFYYFAGKFLSQSLSKEETKDWVREACKKLHVRENSDTILFLTHHTNEPWVIELIAGVLGDCFSDVKPMALNGDTGAVDALVESASQLVLEMGNVDENQERYREFGDSISALADDEPGADPNTEGDGLAFMAKWNLLMKTAEILGQILKNYYGSLEKTQKAAYLSQVFDGPLRAIRGVFEGISGDIEGLITQMDSVLDWDGKKDLTQDERRKKAKEVAFHLLGMMGYGTIAAMSSYVASDKLREDIRNVVQNNPTNAYRLVEIATRLLRPGSPPLQDVKRLAEDLKDQPYAFQILQTLGFQHMYLYHTSESDKQALCSYLNLTFTDTRAALAQRKDIRLLQAS